MENDHRKPSFEPMPAIIEFPGYKPLRGGHFGGALGVAPDFIGFVPVCIGTVHRRRPGSRLLDAGELSRRQTWASRFAAPWLFVYVP
jgi:hypothetical protein